MPLPIRGKQPGEARTITFDFTEKLAVGDALTGTPTMTVAAGLILDIATRSGNTVNARLSGGTDGQDYNVQCACGTTGGDTLNLDVTIQVRDQAN